jgi:proteic killer suppression protein
MEITFEKEYLRELYESGTATDKKHRFQPDVVNKVSGAYKNARKSFQNRRFIRSVHCITKG